MCRSTFIVVVCCGDGGDDDGGGDGGGGGGCGRFHEALSMRHYIAAGDSMSYCRLDQSDVGGLVRSRAAPWHPDVCVWRKRTGSTYTVIETNEIIGALKIVHFTRVTTMFVQWH